MEHEGEKISSCEWDIKNGFTEKLNRTSGLSASDVDSYMIEINEHFKNLDIKCMDVKYKILESLEVCKSNKSNFYDQKFDAVSDYA